MRQSLRLHRLETGDLRRIVTLGVALAIVSSCAACSRPTPPVQAAPVLSERVRNFAALPDWTGLWEQFNVGPNGSPDDPAEDKAFHLAMYEHPPYNADWEAKHPGSKARTTRGKTCTIGFPAIMIGTPLMFQAILTPEEATLIFSLRATRHIYTDGRGHPPDDEIFPTPWGDSIGHWEGDTLVVDTVATSWSANLMGEPLSPQARYTERIRKIDQNTIEDQITIDDPVALANTWQLTRHYHRVPNMNRLIDQDCRGNDRNPSLGDKTTTIAPTPVDEEP